MKWLNRILGAGALVLASLTFSPKKAEACSSAKPMGRGETNVAIADDASAVYWNPAGLVQLEKPELDITIGTGVYKGFLCYGQPLNENNVIGFNFSYRKYKDLWDKGDDIKTLWLKLGYSRKLTNKLSLGANLTFIRNYVEDDGPIDYLEGSIINGDLGFLYKLNNRIKLGLLLQNCSCEYIGPNVRPGVSFKLNDTLLALEGYDITNKFDRRHFRCGLERKVNNNWSVRGGIRIHKNKIENGAFGGSVGGSVGASYRKNDLETSIALVGKSIILSLNKKF